MRILKRAFYPIIFLSIAACGGGGGGSDDNNSGDSSSDVEITDSASLSQAASFENGTRVSGRAPIPSGATAAPMEGPGEIPMTTNSVSELFFEVPLPDENSKIGAVLIEIEGSDEHFVIIPDETAPRGWSTDKYTAHSDIAQNGLTARRVRCAARIGPCEGIGLTAQPLRSGGFSTPVNTRGSVSTAIVANVAPPVPPSYDFSQIPSSSWTQPLQVDVTATPTGSGDLQFTLTWDSTADIDLHVYEPGGTEIWFANPRSQQGFLDVDDIDGFGPENVFYEDGHDAGNYRVEVHHFSGALPTNYTVTITDNGNTRTYSGSVTGQSEEDVVATITSTGSAGGSGGSDSSDSGGDNSDGGSGSGDFCYDNYPSEPCALLETDGGASSSSFTTGNTCSGLGFSGSDETFDFGSDFGSFGESTPIGTVGTCYITF